MLTVAIPKGALLAEAISLLQSVGLDFSRFQDPSNRLLQITDPQGKAAALLVRSQDVPVYVEYGQAQLGIVGDDVLREKQAKVANLVDLGFGACRMSIAVPQHSPYQSALELPPHCRIASKYVNCARTYFQSIDLPVEIIPLYGSVELAPITGMAEAIVDLVSTGRTLRDNGLVETDVLFQSTAHLIAHPLSYRLNRDRLNDWVAQLRPRP
ncbi:MAG: ATP phosphoribosyltransferase [Pseudanabaenaceae cyanobacterium bins.68]|nr:ATP phosphoribosyltransferase [Pseudanabaenaceae cyanobacterium bins.68]